MAVRAHAAALGGQVRAVQNRTAEHEGRHAVGAAQRLNIAKLQRTKGFMPPFAGNAEDVESLVQLLRWEIADAPAAWPPSTDPATLSQISKWLDEVGTK